VEHHDPVHGLGTGYCFDRYEPLDLFTCMVRAWEGFSYRPFWHELQKRAMQQDCSWTKSALEYIRLYSDILHLPYETQIPVQYGGKLETLTAVPVSLGEELVPDLAS
jgi:starch synthase